MPRVFREANEARTRWHLAFSKASETENPAFSGRETGEKKSQPTPDRTSGGYYAPEEMQGKRFRSNAGRIIQLNRAIGTVPCVKFGGFSENIGRLLKLSLISAQLLERLVQDRILTPILVIEVPPFFGINAETFRLHRRP